MSEQPTATAPAEETAIVPADAPGATNWHYNVSMGGDLLADERFFQWDAPESNPNACPEYQGKQVNAIPVGGKGVFPQSILDIAARLAQK